MKGRELQGKGCFKEEGRRRGREGASMETVRDEIQTTQDKNPQNCKEFFMSWVVCDSEVRKSLSEIPFFATMHTNKVTCC